MLGKTLKAVVCLLVLAVTSAWAQEKPKVFGSQQNDQTIISDKKIESELMQALQTQESGDFILHFGQQADLGPAYGMDWEARGTFVYDALRKAANASQSKSKQILDSAGMKYVSFFTSNVLYVRGGDVSLAKTLAGLPEVTAVMATATYEIVPPVIDESVSAGTQAVGDLAWGIVDAGADQFWQSYGTGEGIVVANIDTGVQWNHSALFGAYKCGTDPSDPSCWHDPSNICGASGACDNNGHGTHVMGTMVGDNNPALQWQAGMAPGASWIACKGCESSSCSDFALESCADWIIAPGGNPDNRPHVVNNSWGGSGGRNWYLAKVNAWRAAGIFPAFSAGNNGPSCGSMGSPGDYQESFASAAHNSSGAIASFSSRGPSAFGSTPYTKPNISAPGVNVCSSVPGDKWSCGFSGTSMASPHTAGAVALLWACSPELEGNIDLTVQALQSTADEASPGTCGAPPSGQGNYTYGYGYLDVLAAGTEYCRPAGTLEGQVRNASDNTPVGGARVSADGPITRFAVTDANGFYSMVLSEGTYELTAAAYGFLPEAVSSVDVLEDQITTQDFLLDVAPFSTVSGRIEDAATGWPLYARITIAGRPGDPVWTDPVTGEYSVSLPQGIAHGFTVFAFVDGYVPVERAVGPLTGDRTEDFLLEADLQACTAPGYFLNGLYLQDFESDIRSYTSSSTSTEWEWGEPVTWPGTCASGTKCWGTNLDGNYQNRANSVLTSPVIDLSGVFGPLAASWWQALHMESASWDHAYAEVSINGEPWQVMWQHTGGTSQTPWTEKTYDLSAASGGTARFRFRITTDSSVTKNGYYIDRVAIGGACAAPSGGIVVGNVFDANTQAGLVGALVEDEAGQQQMTRSTPTDPGSPDGFYTLYADVGSSAFEASMAGYDEVVQTVSVAAGTAVRSDFELPAGQLAADPPALSVTLGLGQTATVPLALVNSGGVPVDFDMSISSVPAEATLTTWLGVDPASGSVAAGGSRVIDVLFDAGDAAVTGAGLYQAELRVSNSSPYGDIVIPVEMTVQTCTVSVSASPAEGGSVSGSGTYGTGNSVTVTASPADIYEFVNWTEDGMEVSTSPSYTFTLEADRVLVANFRLRCRFSVKYKKIRSDKLRKHARRSLRIIGGDDFDSLGQIDLGPLVSYRVKYNLKKNRLKIKVIVPAGLAPQVIPIRVGDCGGEVVIE